MLTFVASLHRFLDQHRFPPRNSKLTVAPELQSININLHSPCISQAMTKPVSDSCELVGVRLDQKDLGVLETDPDTPIEEDDQEVYEVNNNYNDIFESVAAEVNQEKDDKDELINRKPNLMPPEQEHS